MNLSVCIITKNESEKLKKCLEAVKGYGFEIVVVDTGSTDGTKEMAGAYTSKIYDFAWCDDFSAARNYAAEQAANEYILMLDSDEYVSQLDLEKLEAAVQKHPAGVGRIKRCNQVLQGNEIQISVEYISRLYSKKQCHYQGRIHEQIVCMDNEKTEMFYELPVTVEHDGYADSAESKRKKAERNIRLLLLDYQERPEDTYVLYQLGKSYYMMGDYEKAVEYFDIALGHDVNPKLEYVIDMVETYGYALLNSGRAGQALGLEGVYEEFGNSADFKLLMGLIYMNNQLFDLAVEEFLKATAYSSARTVGANSYLAYYNAGVIRECLGDVAQAKKYYQKCGDYGKARLRLEVIG